MATPASAPAPPNPNLVSGDPPSLLLQQQQEEEVSEPVPEMASTPLTTSIDPTPLVARRVIVA
jgi:WD repeat-containing protein 45